jgi:hypothetical protein
MASLLAHRSLVLGRISSDTRGVSAVRAEPLQPVRAVISRQPGFNGRQLQVCSHRIAGSNVGDVGLHKTPVSTCLCGLVAACKAQHRNMDTMRLEQDALTCSDGSVPSTVRRQLLTGLLVLTVIALAAKSLHDCLPSERPRIGRGCCRQSHMLTCRPSQCLVLFQPCEPIPARRVVNMPSNANSSTPCIGNVAARMDVLTGVM